MVSPGRNKPRFAREAVVCLHSGSALHRKAKVKKSSSDGRSGSTRNTTVHSPGRCAKCEKGGMAVVDIKMIENFDVYSKEDLMPLLGRLGSTTCLAHLMVVVKACGLDV